MFQENQLNTNMAALNVMNKRSTTIPPQAQIIYLFPLANVSIQFFYCNLNDFDINHNGHNR